MRAGVRDKLPMEIDVVKIRAWSVRQL